MTPQTNDCCDTLKCTGWLHSLHHQCLDITLTTEVALQVPHRPPSKLGVQVHSLPVEEQSQRRGVVRPMASMGASPASAYSCRLENLLGPKLQLDMWGQLDQQGEAFVTERSSRGKQKHTVDMAPLMSVPALMSAEPQWAVGSCGERQAQIVKIAVTRRYEHKGEDPQLFTGPIYNCAYKS